MAESDPGTTKKVVVVAVIHHISRATARVGPSKRVGRSVGRAEQPIRNPHITGRGPARPIKFGGWIATQPGPSMFRRMGRGPARPIKRSDYGPQHDPSHLIFKYLRPGLARPNIFQMYRTGLARPMTFPKVSTRPGPAHHNFQIGPTRPGPDKRCTISPPSACHGPFVGAEPGRAGPKIWEM